MITHGYQGNFQLNRGKYSIDLDEYQFNPNVSFTVNIVLFLDNFLIGMEI
jgi:hypothetical protein